RFRLDLPEREQRGAQIVAGEILPRVRNGVAEGFIELFHEGDGERLLRWEVVRERSLRQSQARSDGGERCAAVPAFGDLYCCSVKEFGTCSVRARPNHWFIVVNQSENFARGMAAGQERNSDIYLSAMGANLAPMRPARSNGDSSISRPRRPPE